MGINKVTGYLKLSGNFIYPGARYFEVRILLENNELSNRRTIAWEPFIRN
jgi:hypothetical protein